MNTKNNAKEEKPPKVKKEVKDTFQTPKGMRDILTDEYFAYQGFYEKAQEVALYYGFNPIETPHMEFEEVFTRSVGEYTDMAQKEMYTLKTKGGDRLALRPEGTAAIMRAYIEHGMHTLPQPVMLYYGGSFFRHENTQRGRFREFKQFGLEIIGSEKSIADATTLKVFTTILDELGIKGITIDINSLGDKECRASYKKALFNYFKKHSSSLGAHERELLQKNPLRILDSKNPEIIELVKDAPESLEHLTGASKQHFKEVLEYLDALSITYRINSRLVRGLDYYSRTVFEILESKTEEPVLVEGEVPEKKDTANLPPLAIASGGRYDYLGRALGSRKDIPAIGGAIGVDRLLMMNEAKRLKPRVLKTPKVFFIQLGFEAKLKSLAVIDILRKARLPIKQTLGKDSLSIQLGMAERMEVPWVIILGQKEVIENSVIVRNMGDRSQQSVPINDLADYIKKVIAK
jgi:histidyl-tRNA synthetase